MSDVIKDSNINDLRNKLQAKYEKEFSTGSHELNILVAGLSGVGKSTLINALFGSDVATTGVGKPQTQEITYYPGSERKIGDSSRTSQISFYDTVGLELDDKQREKVFFDIKNLITRENEHTPHLCWYCVNSEGARIQDEEIDFINQLVTLNIPVIVVLTQSYSAYKADELEKQIRSEVSNICDVVQVVSLESDQEDDRGTIHIKKFGLDKLIELSVKYFQVYAREGRYAPIVEEKVNQLTNVLINEQIVDKKLKRSQAKKVVSIAMAGAASIGAIPIPFADAPLLVGAQEMMMVQIGKIYQKDASAIKKLGLGTLITSAIGKGIVGRLFKLVPGVGSVVGAMITGSVAAVITGSLGSAGIAVCESSLFEDIPLDDLEESFIDLFKNNSDKFKSQEDLDDYLDGIEDEVDKKA